MLLILTTSLGDRYYYNHMRNFTDEENEALLQCLLKGHTAGRK